MRRRSLLKTLAAGTALAASPAWLRRAFAGEACSPQEGLAVAASAYRRAQQAGKPLLVFVIPEDKQLRWERGDRFGELLNWAEPEAMAALAMCELVCARMADLRRLLPTLDDREPAMVLVETDAIPARLTALDLPASEPRAPEPEWDESLSPAEYQTLRMEARRRETDWVDRRIARMGQVVREAIAKDAQAIARRARQAEVRLTPDQLERVRKLTASPSDGDPELVLRGAALVALEASRAAPKQAEQLTALLASAATVRIRRSPVPGSRWANSSGCGTTLEGDDDRSLMVACGMGHVPDKSRRFLYFFSKSPMDLPEQ
jgi:hypothetical protein